MAITKRRARDGSSRYQVRVQDEHGQWYPAKTFSRKVDAEQHERALETKRDSGELAVAADARKVTIKDYFAKWCVERRSRVSEGWRISQDQMLRDYVHPVIGDVFVRNVRPEHIGRVLLKMEETGRGGQTRLHVYQMLHGAFRDAVKYYRLLSSNPVTEFDRPRVDPKDHVKLTPEQTRLLLSGSRTEYVGLAIWISAIASCRPNEVQALRWSAIDFERNEIRVVAGFKRKTGKLEDCTKERRFNVKPMTPALRELLLEARAKSPEAEFVVSGIRGEMLSYGTWLQHLDGICERLSLPRVTPHGLRGCATELWVEAGATEEDVIRLLNHSGAGAVRRYMHRSIDRLHRLAGGVHLPTIESGSGDAPKLQVVR